MAFKKSDFLAEDFQPRTEMVPVPDMKDWFEKGNKPAFKVRGMTGKEIGKSQQAVESNQKLAKTAEGIFSKKSKTIADSIQHLFDPSTPDDIAKRIAVLVMGSVEPEVNEELALKICQYFPIDFFTLTNKITILTGLGHLPGKPKPSGKKQK